MKLHHLLVGFGAVIFLLIAPHAAFACTNPGQIPSGFTTPCPVFDAEPTSVQSSGSVTITVTPNVANQYISQNFFLFNGSTWVSSTLVGNFKNGFSTSTATYTITSSQLSKLPSGNIYLAEWDWTFNASEKCYTGPATSTCNQGYWRLQEFTLSGGQQEGAGDNIYCAPGDVPQFGPGTSDGPASYPSRCINTEMPNISSYKVVTVCPPSAGSCTFPTITAAVTTSTLQCGEIIEVKARDANGNQLIYDKDTGEKMPIPITKVCSASAGWIIMASDMFQNSNFPAEGTRISPGWMGISSLIARPAYNEPQTAGVYIPKIMTEGANTPAMVLSGGAYWRFIGLEFTGAAGVVQDGSIIGPDPNLADVVAGNHIVLDRVVVHGGNNPQGENAKDSDGGIQFDQTNYMALVDSYVYDFVCAQACTDSKAVHLGGNDPLVQEGPFKVVDNYLEATGENILAGGGGTGSGCCTGASNIEIRRNHLYKPATIWQESWPDANGSTTCIAGNGCDNNPNYFGTKVIVKNLDEFKNDRQILFEGNIFENNWGGQSDQDGGAISLDPVSQNRSPQGCANYDGNGHLTAANCPNGKGAITFTPDVVDQYCATPYECHVSLGVEPSRSTYVYALQYNSPTSITVSPGLNPDQNGVDQPFTQQMISQCRPGADPLAEDSDLILRDNIVRHAAHAFSMTSYSSQCGDLAQGIARVSIHDNQVDDINGWQWNLKKGACCSWAVGVRIGNSNTSQSLATKNISISHNTLISSQEFNAGTEGSVNISNTCGGDCPIQIQGVSIRDNIGIDGLDDGGGSKDYCDNNKFNDNSTDLFNCIVGTSPSPSLGWCITGNVLTNAVIANDPDYPPPGKPNTPWPTQSPACPSGVSTANYNPADFLSVGFINFNNGIGGNYQLQSGSPYIGKASDGGNPGANIAAVDAATAGVQ